MRKELKEEVLFEESPVGESHSNGISERAVREVKWQVRSRKEALDSRYGKRISNGSPITAWLPRHVAATISRYRIGVDGMTAYERVNGKKFKIESAEFGERAWYLNLISKGRLGTACRWGVGIWLGIRQETGEALIGNKEGLMKARRVRRRHQKETDGKNKYWKT